MIYLAYILSFLVVLLILRSRHHRKRKAEWVAEVQDDACARCRNCIARCSHQALKMVPDAEGPHITVLTDACTGCGKCVEVCHFDALHLVKRNSLTN